MVVTLYRIGTRSLKRLAVSHMATGSYTVQRYTPGSMELECVPHDPCARMARTDDILNIDGWDYLIERVEPVSAITSRVRLGGRQLIALADRRQILPDAAAAENMPTGFDSVSGSTETVIKHYIRRHVTEPVNTARRIPRTEIAVDRNRGIADDAYHARYVNLLETVDAIGQAAYLSPIATVDANLERIFFDVVERVDRTIEQKQRPPLVLRAGDGRVDKLSVCEDVQGAANVFYCSRAGDRYAYETLTQTYFSTADEPQGLDRREVSASISVTDNANQYTEMRENAKKLMPDYAIRKSVDCVVAHTMQLGVDYNVGDVASILDPRSGAVFAAEITAATVSETDGTRQVSVTFGEPKLTRFDAIKRTMRTEG